MPHRIFRLTHAHYPDPLVDYSSTEYILEFQDAAQILQKWRNPHLGRSSREGTVLSFAEKARASITAIQQKILTTELTADQEEELVDQMKVYRFMLDKTLPRALELVNLDQLLTPEDIEEFIRQQIRSMEEEYGQSLLSAEELMSNLMEITDIEVTDQFGRKQRIARNDVMDVIGSVLGNILLRQVSLWPVDDVISRPRGRLHQRKTYVSAIMREGNIPPPSIRQEDIRVVDKDRLGLIYFILDMSQSMNKRVFKEGLTRLDGALLTALGLFYYFRLYNRRKRREFDSFKMHIVPVTKQPYVISDTRKFEKFLLEAEGKGKTRLVHATHVAIQHATENYKDIDYDVQLVYLTDGRPNVPFEGKLPGRKSHSLQNYFKSNIDTKTPKDAQTCMMQLNQVFEYLKRSKDRNWSISYFLMANKKFLGTELYKDTKEMLSNIARPVLIDPTEIDDLGRRILQETIVGE